MCHKRILEDVFMSLFQVALNLMTHVDYPVISGLVLRKTIEIHEIQKNWV